MKNQIAASMLLVALYCAHPALADHLSPQMPLCDRGDLRQNLGMCVDVSYSASTDRTPMDRLWTKSSKAVQDDRGMPYVYDCIDNALASRLQTISWFPHARHWLITISPLAMRDCHALKTTVERIPEIQRSYMARFMCSETETLLESRIGKLPLAAAVRTIQSCASVFVPYAAAGTK